MTTKELLDLYYAGLAQKKGWEDTLSDDFKLIGGDMLKPEPIVGKAAYIGVIARFSKLYTNMRPTEIIIDGDRAYVTGNYDYVFPNGQALNANVAEVWTVKNGKLDALTIYFDTLNFSKMVS